MICSHCKTPNPNGARFCIRCGSRMRVAAPGSGSRNTSSCTSLEIIQVFENDDLQKGGQDGEAIAERIARDVLHASAYAFETPTQALNNPGCLPSLYEGAVQHAASQPVSFLQAGSRQIESARAFNATHPYATPSQRLAGTPKRYPYRSRGAYAPRHARSAPSRSLRVLKAAGSVIGTVIVCAAVFAGGWFAAQAAYDVAFAPAQDSTQIQSNTENGQAFVESASDHPDLSAEPIVPQTAPDTQDPLSQSPSSTQPDENAAAANSQSLSQPPVQPTESEQWMRPFEERYVHTSPDIHDETICGTIEAGQSVRIVEVLTTEEEPGYTFGRLENGTYVCLSHEDQEFFEKVPS